MADKHFWVYPPPVSAGGSWSFKAMKNDAPFTIFILDNAYLPKQASVASPADMKEHWMENLMPLIKDKTV